ncbi:MAG: hypothetical protein E7029_08120 [Planctomycetaceae bacterium]|nr:hypothetical protein [Planctomycetaceae bacterium]
MPRPVLFAVGVFLILAGLQCRYVKSFTFEIPKYTKSETAAAEERTWVLEPQTAFTCSIFTLGVCTFLLGLTQKSEKSGKGD